ncbi:Crp/Fnr family transcriptional regulator [Flavobacterium salilacus subsp. salilacus]|uniref:Crp/Fnr family transcriptional regulator n=1 Tax=Flavobacterium TaxID=237 RepID=UPI0010755555|nr:MULTISPECIES: cyclic nucleotide-binding domain-containing protein [Flavobacterium]KAF2518721.1 Crp/Fnr family transcriptional regulator [Flavobacterium salilacus subsp. salilacus]MBE1613687.1 Crp/Fnr family transcriptional regulator [Flavobacterium sp. SaA2.13]
MIFFLEEGKGSKHLAFIETGIFQYYVITPDGVNRTTYVAHENNFLASLLSFLNEVPSREYIKAMTDAVIHVIDKKDLQQLLLEMDSFKYFYIRLLEWQLVCIDKSRLDLLLLSPEQRYENIMRDEPHLLEKIPLNYLASILGITPRHLTRIRKKI